MFKHLTPWRRGKVQPMSYVVGEEELKAPSLACVKRYGMSLEDWWALANKQSRVCVICRRAPKGQLVVDHEHVPGWRRYPPEVRRQFVRGLLCFRCNWRFMAKGMTAQFAIRMGQLLMEYGLRRPLNLPPPPKKKRRRSK